MLLASLAAIIALFILVVVATVFTTRKSKQPVVEQPGQARLPADVIGNPDVDPGSSAGDMAAPGFVLRDQRGRLTSLKQFRGKVVVLAFIDSHCTTICPLTTESMVEALRLLGPAASQVQLLGINANPLATRIADVAGYTRAHQMQGRWRFLTGSLPQLERVWHGYHVYVAAVHNDIDHNPIVFLIGPRGHERTIYLTQMSYEGVAQQAQLLAEGIARLLPHHPPVRHEVSLRYLPPFKPTETVRLSAFGSHGPVVVFGPAHPCLLLFFAGWLREDVNLRARLDALNAYAATARRRGWPLPVAVNELPTEASPAAARKLLSGLSTTLHAPIVEDSDGRLADGYGVQGLPWFVLCSPSGRILWHHSGWLSPAALIHHVHAALAKSQHASAA